MVANIVRKRKVLQAFWQLAEKLCQGAICQPRLVDSYAESTGVEGPLASLFDGLHFAKQRIPGRDLAMIVRKSLAGGVKIYEII